MVSSCAQLSHPPNTPIASQSISRDVLLARARGVVGGIEGNEKVPGVYSAVTLSVP